MVWHLAAVYWSVHHLLLLLLHSAAGAWDFLQAILAGASCMQAVRVPLCRQAAMAAVHYICMHWQSEQGS
jgi:hypothetical protein